MSPSLQTMGFFMSDINFCNTKEQLNHLGEVVTGKVDGSPTGADIDTSTLPYTGQVRKTLPALEQEYLEAIQGAGGVSIGVWTSGVTTFNSYNEYAVYNGIPYKPRTATALPYVAQGSDPTAVPDDANVQPYQEITEAQVVAIVEATIPDEIPKYTDMLYKTSGGNSAVENMIAEFAANPLMQAIGTIIKTGGTTWRYKDSTGPITIGNFRAFNVLNALDCGATGDPLIDDTDALDYANGLSNSTGLSLFLPKGHYVYNGTGLGTEDYVQVIGEGSGTIIDAGSNTNSGYLFTMGNGVGGRRTRLRKLELRGNPDNALLRGVNFTLTQEDSGADELVFQDWHYGLELNRLFYCHFSDISFRNSPGVTLTGSHLNIGDSDTSAEVNNIEFSKIHFLGSQNACVTVNCYTQTLIYNSCSFETTGTRFKFVTDRLPNTTTLNGCYIEGSSTDNAIIASSQVQLIKMSFNDCLIRVDGNNSSVMFDNVHGFLEACHGGSPNVLLASATGRVTYIGDNTISTRDNFFVLQGGSWDNSTEETNFERLSATPKRLGAQEYNAIIPKFVHQKTVNQGASSQAIFAVYLPADGSNQRKIRLDLNVTLQATGATPNVGQDKWTLLFYKGGGVGDGSTSGHQALLVSQGGNYVNANTVELTQLGYNAVTDSTKYLVSYSPTTDVYDIDCFFEIEGTFHNSSSDPERSWPWRIEKI